jgi:hypothetical protein
MADTLTTLAEHHGDGENFRQLMIYLVAGQAYCCKTCVSVTQKLA